LSVNENRVAVGIEVSGYLVCFGVIVPAALSMPL